LVSNWIHDDKGNALSDANVEAIRTCLGRAGSVVFGWHYHYYGGSSRSELVFGSADDLLRYIDRSRRGDHFTLYDLDRVASLAFLHLGTPESETVVDLHEQDRSRLAETGNHSRWKAVVLVQRALDADGRVACCSVYEIEPDDLMRNWEEANGYTVQAIWPPARATWTIGQWPGELYTFDETVLDLNQETGQSVDEVSPAQRKRSLALIDAKRPDDHGMVPISGAY
jgi:hypothetical protein